jgi:hypothetical protein
MKTPSQSPNQRFRELWEAAQEEDSCLIAHIDSPYVEGSLRPEVKSVGGIVVGEVFTVSNLDVAGSSDNQEALTALAALETLR